jgi:hypothetical protein
MLSHGINGRLGRSRMRLHQRPAVMQRGRDINNNLGLLVAQVTFHVEDFSHVEGPDRVDFHHCFKTVYGQGFCS